MTEMPEITKKTAAGSSHWRALVWILLAGLALRLGIWLVFCGEKLQIVDEIHYDDLAAELAQSGDFINPAEGFISIRPPLYPWLVSEIYHFAGLRNYAAVRGVQIFLSLLTAVFVFGLARELNEITARSALWAAAVFCFYPSLVIQNFFLLTETFFTFWLVLVLWTALRFLRTGSLYAAGFCGIFIAFGALTRSILWLSPLPLALFFLFCPISASVRTSAPDLPLKPIFSWKRRMAGALLLLLFAGVGMAPWIIRNTKIQRTFTPIDCMSGRNLMMGNYEFTPLYRAWDAISMEPPRDWYSVLSRELAEQKKISLTPQTQGQKDHWASWYAKRYVCQHPFQTIQRDGMKALCFWQLERSIPSGALQGFWGFDRIPAGVPRKAAFTGLTICVLLPYVLLFGLAVLGVFSFPYHHSNLPGAAFLLAVLLYFWFLHSLAFAHERYHLPLVPILILFAVWFAGNWSSALSRLRQNPVRYLPAALMLTAFVVFWSCEIYWAAS